MPTISPTSYIFPPRAKTAIPRSSLSIFETLDHIAQLKYNDTHILLKYQPNTPVEIWNRHGSKLNYHITEELNTELQTLATLLNLNPNEWHLLDGGLLDNKHPSIKDTIVIWDILVKNGNHLVGTTYNDRWTTIHNITTKPWYYNPPHKKHQPIPFGSQITENIFTPNSYTYNEWDSLWDIVELVNTPYLSIGNGPVLEGLVIKDPNGQLERAWKADNNHSWMTRSRVSTGRHNF